VIALVRKITLDDVIGGISKNLNRHCDTVKFEIGFSSEHSMILC